jgi:hypothetical protein
MSCMTQRRDGGASWQIGADIIAVGYRWRERAYRRPTLTAAAPVRVPGEIPEGTRLIDH